MTQEREIVFPESERAELCELRADQPRPGSALSDNDVEGRTLVSAVSPGTELAWGFRGDTFPRHPGYAAVFTVERVGGSVKHLRAGDVAFCMGAHRSFQRHSATRVVRVPDGLAPEVAVFARLMAISMTTLVTTKARPPAHVVVTGLGIVGHLAAQVFRTAGYSVLGCDPIASRRELLEKRGIPTTSKLDPSDAALSNQVDLVVDCSGHESAVLDACGVVRKGGEVVLVGVPWARRSELTAHAVLHAVFHRYVVLRSGWEWELPIDDGDFRAGSVMSNLSGALEWLKDGRLDVSRLADVASPEDAQRVYSELASRDTRSLTTVFDWTHV